MIGQSISHYRILERLGGGGMGVVYKAEDNALHRFVALKFLSDGLANDPNALARFQREAHLASSLNHPHILTVFETGEFEGRRYLVTEFVDGGTLRDWANAENRSWRHVVELLIGVADGVAAAHQAGIVHRDIKLANILVAKSGYAKLADFGLAKPTEATAGDATRTVDGTTPGMIIGTVAYMSPEQALGKPVDARSDVFSFGVVLYELLSGRHPFTGASDLETLQTIIHGVPPRLSEDVPVALEAVVEKALEKDPADRYQTMRDMVVDLRRIARKGPEGTIRPAARARLPWLTGWRTGLALAAALALGVFIGWFLLRAWQVRQAHTQTVQVQRLTDLVGLEETPAISPDGKTVAFVAVTGGRRQIWVRLLSGGTPLAITKDDTDHYGPRWSPDSSSLIYYTPGKQAGESGTLWEIPALGGPVRRLVDALGPGDVSHDGKYLAFFRFHDGAIELAVAARDQSGGRQVAKLQTGAYNSPRWSPDDQQIAFVNPYFGATFEALLLIANASGGTPRAVASELDFQGFTWVPDGTGLIVSSSRGTTMSYPPTYNLWFLGLGGGAPVQLTFGESSYEFPDINRTGGFVASRVHEHSDIWKFPVKGEPVDNVLRAVRITTQTGKAQTLTLSPDESEVAFLSDNGGHANVWVARVSDGEMRAITQESDPRVIVGVPYWSPRGDVINFLSNRNSGNSDVTLWLVKPDGSESRDLGIIGVFVCWSKDGSQLYFSDQQKGIWHIAKVSVEGGQPVTVRTDNAIGCSSAPDGTLYYTKLLTQATGAWDFEIRAANPENGASRVLGSIAGSRVPAGAGNFQVYVSPDGRWLGMALKDGSTTNLWALSTTGGGWRKLTDFGTRNVVIARRIAWSKDDKYLYGSVSDVDSDVVRLSGLRW